MDDIEKNALEFLESGKDNLKKNRWNAAVSDFFKSMVTFLDIIIYKNFKILPKNHNERFDLLKKYYPAIYSKMINLFKKYRESYSLRLTEADAKKMEEYADEIRNFKWNKKKTQRRFK